MADAKVRCPDCRGTGYRVGKAVGLCPRCRGGGLVPRESENERRPLGRGKGERR